MYDNKRIFILGMARSGYEVAKLLAKHGCEIVLTDKVEQDSEHVLELTNLGVDVIITETPENLLDESFAYVVKNPGIRIDHAICQKAQSLNIPVVNEVEVAYHYLPKGVKLVGISGSNGKTTTTTLTYEFLKAAGLPVHLGGNIGFPFCSILDQVKENDIVVLEISAQQLHDFNDFKLDVAILTNLTEVHIDFFKTYEYYKQSKKRLFRHHTSDEIAVLNKNDEDMLKLTDDIASNKLYFNSNGEGDAYIKDGAIYYHDSLVVELKDIKLQGTHNYENIMAATLAYTKFTNDFEPIRKVLKEFGGVEHRLEYVKTVNNREFYNDSKATNVKSTQIALNAFNKPTILLLGGLDRGHSFDGLIPYMKNTKAVVCYGETKNRIKDFCDSNNFECYVCDNLTEATKKAYELSNEGDVILLSPACASWDQYKKFEDRGDEFKQIVNSL